MNRDCNDTITVFTARSPGRIMQEGASQAWKLDPEQALGIKWLIVTQNQHNRDKDFSDASEPHGTACLLGRVSGFSRSHEPDALGRYMIEIGEAARINIPKFWDGGRWPVRYGKLSSYGIDPTNLKFESLTKPDDKDGEIVFRKGKNTSITIAAAKKALGEKLGLSPKVVRQV
jgi:hypothetical protein